MSSILDTLPSRRIAWLEWAPVAAGLAALYGPTFYDLSRTLWPRDDYAHGPFVLAIIVWLFWMRRGALLAPPLRTAPVSGFAMLIAGLVLYAVGRSQDIILFEVGSLAPVLAGVLLVTRGWAALRTFWFALFFVAFLVPLPGFFVDALTGPLKRVVSVLAEDLLYAAGYPIGRNGVVLTIGQYQLLVADACSGLHTMFSLSAVGLFYIYVLGHKSRLHNALLVASILPIAFCANIVRVIVLVLVTWYLGDEVAQGFTHGFSGLMIFIVALLMLFALDALLQAVGTVTGRRHTA